MQPLQLALYVVMLELTVGSFVSLVVLDARGDTSRGFVVFQGALYLVFALLTLLVMNGFATPELVHGYGLDTAWLGAQGPLVLTFSLLMLPWNVLLWSDRQAPNGAKRKPNEPRPPASPRARLRYAVGGVAAAVGLAALVVDGMAYRTLAESHLGGVFVVASFVAGGIALGTVMTAMLLGHWYLNTPTASGRPLEFATTLMLAALAAELVFSLLIGPSTAHPTLKTIVVTPGTTIVTSGNHFTITTPTAIPASGKNAGQTAQPAPSLDQVRQAPTTASALGWLQFLMGFLSPIVLGAVALYLTRGRSFQSATGMLYLCVAFVFIGEILGRGLLVFPVFG